MPTSHTPIDLLWLVARAAGLRTDTKNTRKEDADRSWQAWDTEAKRVLAKHLPAGLDPCPITL